MRERKTCYDVAAAFIRRQMEYQKQLPKRPVAAPAPEETLERLRRRGIPRTGRAVEDVVRELCEDVLPYGNHNDHPRFFGFIPGPASPLSWLGDVMTAAYNRHAGSVANQPAVWCVEQELIRWLNDRAGFPAEAGGLFVSGGSMANLTAMTIARDSLLPEEDWSRGVAYVSGQTHSSVEKGLRIIGIGSRRVRCIPTDDRFRMDVGALRAAVEEDVRRGLKPFLVVATAVTTNTGSVDPLAAIRRLCDEQNLWMHVDGAFGASALLSGKHRKELAGIEQADSLSWDAHKWLFQTLGCGMVLVRDQKRMLESFSVHPEYLRDLERGGMLVNPWDLGVELTRPARCVKLWLTLQVMGSNRIGGCIEHGIESAEWVEWRLRAEREIEIVCPAQLAIINFRYAPAELSEVQRNALNHAIAEKMLEDGYAGVFTTELNGKTVLRMCTLHPDVTKAELGETLMRLDRYYRQTMEELAPARRPLPAGA